MIVSGLALGRLLTAGSYTRRSAGCGKLVGDSMSDASCHGPHPKITAGGHRIPLGSVKSPEDRSAYVSEAKGIWLYAVAWPASAGYFLAEHVVLHDLSEGIPPELVYGAPSPYLHGRA